MPRRFNIRALKRKLLSLRPALRRLTKVLKKIAIGFGALIGFVASVYGIWGNPFPTSPEIQRATDPGSYSFPFTIKNTSSAFSMLEVELNCLVTKERFVSDTPGIEIGEEWTLDHSPGRDTDIPLESPTILPGRQINYGCDAMMAAPLTFDGRPDYSHFKLVTFVAKVQFKVNLLFFSWHRTYYSTPFTWQKVGNETHWLEGPIIETPK